MSRRYIVSRDEIAAAREIPLLPLLEQRGYALKKDGRYYRLVEHDSIVIDPLRNRWYWNSQGIINANTVDWLILYEHMSLPDAVYELLGNSSLPLQIRITTTKPKANSPPVFPPPHTDNRRAFAYLVKRRCLSSAVVKEAMQEGLIYEDTPYHNAVFIRKDDDGQPAGYFARGTLTGSHYKNDPETSDKRWTFLLPGQDDRLLYITEAAIDACSVETLRRTQQLAPRRFSILSLAGNQITAAKWYLKRHPAQVLCCCTDNDDGGETAYTAIREFFPGTVLRALPPAKDWNEVCQLQEKRPLPFQQIEKEF